MRRSPDVVFVMAFTLFIFMPAVAHAAVAMPTVTGPIPYSLGIRGFPFMAVPDSAELAAAGYSEEEFFFYGEVSSQAYGSRMIVRRPMDSRRFNGTVVVEWLNVTVGADIDVDWALTRRQILRDGYAYVGVTTQPVGACWLETWDPLRYATLAHPALPPGPCPASNQTETDSFEIFSQAGKAIRDDRSLLGGLEVRRLIAIGASQSARRLVGYTNAYQAAAGIYDGFLIHVIGGGGGAAITEKSVPVLILNSENEVLGYYPYRDLQPPNVRYWEVAGAGHTPELSYIAAQVRHAGVPFGHSCEYPDSSDFIHMYPVGDAALDALQTWLVDGSAPVNSPLVTVIAGTPRRIARDDFGNAVGGIRLPQIEVPTARLIGTNGPANSLLCRTTGGIDFFDGEAAGATPNDTWSEPTIEQLYGNHGTYVSAFVRAVDAIVKSGFMLQADAQIAKREAAAGLPSLTKRPSSSGESHRR